MSNGITDLIGGSEGGEIKTFQTGERSECSKQKINAGGKTIYYYEIMSSLINNEALKVRIDIYFEFDGCDVFNGDASYRVINSYPLDSFDFGWKFKLSERDRDPLFPDLDCCRRARCVILEVKLVLKSGIDIWRIIGIGGDTAFERKFLICGDGHWEQLAP